MILDFQALVEKALGDMAKQRFLYQDDFYRLAPNARIETDMALMSGTSEGVIFTAPTRRDYIEIIGAYLMAGGPWSGRPLDAFGEQTFIAHEIASGHFLQPGDRVHYRSSVLGDILVQVVE